jgi:acyl-CoA reductase-like NAD-dependent aldehyde dehydrogenase
VTALIDNIVKAKFTQTINGQALASAYEDVINPATGAPFQQSPAASPQEIDLAVSTAREAQPAWAALTWDERQALIVKLADAIESEKDYLATLLVMEQGMPLAEALFSTGYAAHCIRTIAAVRLPTRTLLDHEQNKIIERWSPLGVVGAIAPWNAPIVLGMHKVANALIGGNAVVLKPSELTPLATLEVGRIAASILPAGVFNVIGGGREVGAALVAHKGLDKISFTGSSPTGSAIAKQSAEYLRPVTLELGGNDAAILLPDGSIADLVSAVVTKGLANRGQFCAAVKRVYVPTHLYDTVCEALVKAVSGIKLGSGLEPSTQMGPIQNKAQFDKICAFVEDAKAAGGRILTGGAPLERDGYFYPPTIIAGLSDGARIVDEEQFGPIMPIIAYDDLDTVIRNINSGAYGLTSSVWTADLERGAEVASQIAVGTGWVNQHGNFDITIPFPMIKASGIGFDFADYGVKGAMRMQIINVKK